MKLEPARLELLKEFEKDRFYYFFYFNNGVSRSVKATGRDSSGALLMQRHQKISYRQCDTGIFI